MDATKQSVLNTIFKDITNLELLIEEAKTSQMQLDLEGESDDFTKYVDTAKHLVTTLKSSIEKINDYFNEHDKMLTKDKTEIEPMIKTEEEVVKVGTIKLVDLSKLIDPNRANKVNNNNKKRNSVSSDCAIVILSDSGSDVPAPVKTRSKRSTRFRDSDSDTGSRRNSRCNGIKNNSRTRFALRNKDKRSLAKLKESDISISSSDSDDDSRSKARGRRGRPKKVTFEIFNEKRAIASQDDVKFAWKCYVNLPRVPAERLKADYMRKLELNEIKKLSDLKSLKRSRKNAEGSDSSTNSQKPARKRSEKRERKKKEKNAGSSSSDSSKSDDEEPIAVVAATDKNKNDVPDILNGDVTGNFDIDLLNAIQPDGNVHDASTDKEEDLLCSKQKQSLDKDEGKAEEKDKDKSTKDKTNAEDDIENTNKIQSESAIPEDTELIEKNNSDEIPKENESDISNLQEPKDADNDDAPTNGNKEPDSDKTSEEINDKEKLDETDEGNISPEKDKKDDDKRKDDDDNKKSLSDDKVDETEEDDEDDDDDKKKKKKKKAEEKDKNNSDNEESSNEKKDSDASDNETLGKKTNSNWKKDKLLTAAISSDSEGDKKKSKKKRSEKRDNSSSDSDNKKVKEKAKSRKERKDDSSDSDSDNVKEKSKKRKGKHDDSSSDSDIESTREKFKKLKEKREKSALKKKKRMLSDSDDDFKESSSQAEEASSSSEESVKEDKEKDKKTNRRRIKRVKDSSDDDEDKSTRKHIRKVWNKDSLAETTKQAEKNEQERKARIAERQKKYNNIFEEDKLEKSTLSKVVLDFNEETEEELLRVNEKIVKSLKPHQGKGIQFMWDACFESIDRAKNTEGSGCILAHCMGLGKTLQVITLVHTLLAEEEKTGVRKVLVVCPLSTVLNWVAEFKKWLPRDDVVEVFDLVAYKDNRSRLTQMQEWDRCGGVLILGYDMFRNLSNEKNARMSKKLRKDFNTSLVDPGPDLVVCDEGHLLKNEKTSLSICMNRLKTMRRIVLTGTPLQNNLKEYWCMVQFVKPNLLGTYKEYLNRFVNPITNGQYTDSTPHDIQIMRKRSHVLHKLLDGIVQRRDYSVLAPFLPPKYEYVLFISLTETQVKLYQHYITHCARQTTPGGKASFLFTDFQELQRICTHPRVMLDKSIQQKIAQEKKDWENEAEDSEGSLKDFIADSSGDESSAKSTSSGSGGDEGSGDEKCKDPKKNKYRRRTRAMAENESDKEAEAAQEPEPEGRSEWWGQYIINDELDNIVYSGKLHLLFEILHQCELMGDKVLVFSQSLYSLNVIEYFLARIDDASQSGDSSLVGGYSGSWSLGLDYFRLDGSSSCDNRAAWCKTFNDPNNIRARLFLISTRAGGLGINLVAANRVVIFDVSWNPSHDIQSIYRVYRFGQTKPSYVYRFVTLGTMEMKIYERQVIKQSISKRVIDEQQIDRHYNQNDLAELYKFEPVPEEERPTPLVPKDILLGELLQSHEKLVYKYHEHQSLLENKEDEVLDEEERKAAWEEFENEKKARTFNYNTGVGANVKGLPMSTVISALKNIIKREHPIFTQREIDGVIPQLLQELTSQMNAGDMSLYQKVITETRIMQQRAQQMAQQQKMQEYYQMQQQWKLFQKFQQQMGQSGVPQDPVRFMQQMQQQQQQNQRQQGTSSRNTAANIDPLEVVSLDD